MDPKYYIEETDQENFEREVRDPPRRMRPGVIDPDVERQRRAGRGGIGILAGIMKKAGIILKPELDEGEKRTDHAKHQGAQTGTGSQPLQEFQQKLRKPTQ